MPSGTYKRIKKAGMFGKKHTKETKEKISVILKGRKLPEEHRLKIIKALKGRKCSNETRKKISEAQKGEKGNRWGKHHSEITKNKLREINKKLGIKPPIKRGSDHYSWKGGITPEKEKIRKSIEYEIWRNGIFTRDSYTCQKYGIRGVKLNAHHVQNFAQHPELRFAIDNGITLSNKAHKEFHKIFGFKNNTKEQLEEFLLNKHD